MKKYLFLTLSLTSLILLSSGAYAQEPVKSMDFRISVYIPPIVGINVPTDYPGAIALSEAKYARPETTVEKTIHDNQLVTLKTTVMR